MKGTAKAPANVKPMAGGTVLYQMQIGDYAYGTVSGLDLVGFTHFYRKAGTVIELGSAHKAYGLAMTNESEVVTPPPPPVTEKRKAVWIVDGKSYFFTED